MKVLVVEGEPDLGEVIAINVASAGAETLVLIIGRQEFKMLAIPRNASWEAQSPQQAADEAELIFLDNNMPGGKGEELLKSWGIDLSTKRVIGTATEPSDQPYLTEHAWPDAMNTGELKQLLRLP